MKAALHFSTEEQFLAFANKLSKKRISKKYEKKQQKENKTLVIAGGYTSHVKGWRTIGGKKHFFKSLWEMNYAHFLEWQKVNKEIYDWEYEPELFRFPTDAYKAGPFYYKPDFKVFKTKLKHRWHEVKGVLNPKSKKKIKRFEKFHPQEGKIILIDKHWFKDANKKIGKVIPGWMTYGQFLRMKGG